MADRSLSYYLGPHLSQGLLNAYNAGRGLLGLMSPGADVRDAVQSSQSAMQNLGQGNVGAGLLDLVYTPAALAGMFIPGSIGGTRRVGEAAVDEILGLVDDVDPSMPRRLVNPEMRGGGSGGRLGSDDYYSILARQRRSEGMTAAMRDPQTGKIYTGHSHQAAIDKIPPTDETGAWGRLQGEWDRGTDNTGFVKDGKFISRSEAEADLGAATMEDVRDLRAGRNLDRLTVTPQKAPDLPMDEASRMARAREMGFDVDVYHGTDADISEFKPGRRGDGISVALTPTNAEGYGGVTMPLKVRSSSLFDPAKKADVKNLTDAVKAYHADNMQKSALGPEAAANFYPYRLEQVLKGIESGNSLYLELPEVSDILKTLGFDGHIGKEGPFTQAKIFDPKNIRSRFAKFDPSKKDSANILAGVGGGLLATGVAGLLGAGAYGQQEQ